LPDFSWWYYNSIAEECDSEIFTYPVYENCNSWKSDIQEIVEKANTIDPDILLLASPNNPTGSVFSFEELKWILGNVNKTICVFIDEAYSSWDAESISQTSELIKMFPNVMIGRSFSKYFGLPGLRIGFCILGEKHEHLYQYVHRYLGYNRVSNHIACAALNSCAHYNQIYDNMTEIKRFVEESLSNTSGLKVYKSQANFVLCKIDGNVKTRLEQELVENGFKVRFINGPDNSGSYMRFSLAPREVIHEMVSIINNVLRQQ